ncbi:MAG: type I 3-dehydroquinate dehydratase [Phycisphaerales bacterium]|nr:type I 3-dehydroquinate dehydratase [Phycisphaerales bacterium]
MTLLAVSILVSDPSEVAGALNEAKDAVASGADLVEWRVDELADVETVPAMATLVEDAPCACILTVRSEEEGGQFDGEPEDLADILNGLRDAGVVPRYIDLEYESWVESDELQGAWSRWQDVETGLILSMHDIEGRPEDLLQTVEAMAGVDAASIRKFAWRARSVRDNFEAFHLLQASVGPTIALCMGEAGLPSRVLAGPAGGVLTFASSASGPTASGQCDLDTMLKQYRLRSLTESTKVFGIIGSLLGHTLSPVVHNAGFEITGYDGVFLPLPVAPGWESFKATVSTLLTDGSIPVRGLCVTLPHKEHALRYVQELGGEVTDIALRAGAANTIIINDDGTLVADNTDAPAVVETLGIEPSGSRIAVLGAGGAARAAVAGLLTAGARVDVFNRSTDRAQALVETMDDPMCTLGDWDEVSGYDAVINTTSVGMAGGPDPEGNPIEQLGLRSWMLEEAQVVYECVYAPRRTPLVELAESLGTAVVTGEAMFLAQAVRQFKAWTGNEAPVEQWRQLID